MKPCLWITHLSFATNSSNNSSDVSTSTAKKPSNNSKSSTAGPYVSGRGRIFYSLPSFTNVARDINNLVQKAATPLCYAYRNVNNIKQGFYDVAVNGETLVNGLQQLARAGRCSL